MPIPKPIFLNDRNLAYTDDAATVPQKLTEHARTIGQGIYQVAEHFYVAVGYGNANMTMVEGHDGIILIDSMDTEESAGLVLQDFRKVTDKPIKALIYTHMHPDHTSGARALLDPSAVENGDVKIYAHKLLPEIISGNPALGIVPPTRLAYQFGLALENGPAGLVEVGLGPLLHVGKTGFLPPTSLFQGMANLQIAGINLQLHEAPSESDDELVIWFPDYGVLHGADVIQGETLANLYALRGVARDPLQWIRALDLMRGFDAQALILGHGRPLEGADDLENLLISYRDAIQYIHDQSVRLMARGYTPDELVEVVSELPPRLRDHPWLGEFYGTVPQIVRQIYSNYFGWFEGDPTFLDPLPRKERSSRYIAAMGGRDAVLALASDANKDGDYRWAAEILTYVIRENPDDEEARQLKSNALRQLGYQATNPIWRNFYLTAARELDGTLDRLRLRTTLQTLPNPDIVATAPIPLVLRACATRINPEKSAGTYLTASFSSTDTNAHYGLAVRSEIAEDIIGKPHEADIEILAREATIRELLGGRLSWSEAKIDSSTTLRSGTDEEATRFWSLFDPPASDLPAIALR